MGSPLPAAARANNRFAFPAVIPVKAVTRLRCWNWDPAFVGTTRTVYVSGSGAGEISR